MMVTMKKRKRPRNLLPWKLKQKNKISSIDCKPKRSRMCSGCDNWPGVQVDNLPGERTCGYLKTKDVRIESI